jgi:hypothetical protein
MNLCVQRESEIVVSVMKCCFSVEIVCQILRMINDECCCDLPSALYQRSQWTLDSGRACSGGAEHNIQSRIHSGMRTTDLMSVTINCKAFGCSPVWFTVFGRWQILACLEVLAVLGRPFTFAAVLWCIKLGSVAVWFLIYQLLCTKYDQWWVKL